MTPVRFKFMTPEGDPLANTAFEIALPCPGYHVEPSGVVLPRIVEATTDVDGEALIELWPLTNPYEVTAYDPVAKSELFYKFIVPVLPDGETELRLQDIIVTGTLITQSTDPDILAQMIDKYVATLAVANTVLANLNTGQDAADTAVAAAAAAEISATTASDAALSATTSAGTATTAAGTATTAAGTATTAADAAAISETNAEAAAVTAVNAAVTVEAFASPTGIVDHYFGNTAPPGWVRRLGQTIGSALSGATERAHADTAALFAHIWAITSNAGEFVIQDSLGVATTRGASAADDFAAHKRMPLPFDGGLFDRNLNTGGSGYDAGRVLGTVQADDFKAHFHGLHLNSGAGVLDYNGAEGARYDDSGATTDGAETLTVGGAETRPANRAYLPIIKL